MLKYRYISFSIISVNAYYINQTCMRKVKNVRRQQVCLKVPKVGSLEKAENCTQKTHQGSRHSSQNCRLRNKGHLKSVILYTERQSQHCRRSNKAQRILESSKSWSSRGCSWCQLLISLINIFFPPKLEKAGLLSTWVVVVKAGLCWYFLPLFLPPCFSPSLPSFLLPNT